MKLYFSPGACSLSPHIVLRELGLPFEAVKTDIRAHTYGAGQDFHQVNPKGAVPTLQLDDGTVITEGAVIVQVLADLVPEKNLSGSVGIERIRVQEWLNYVATEMHKTFSPLFNPKLSDETKQVFKDKLLANLRYLSTQLEGKQYLTGDRFTVADAYLFTILGWFQVKAMDLAQYPVVKAYYDRVHARPAVQAALEMEKAARTKV